MIRMLISQYQIVTFNKIDLTKEIHTPIEQSPAHTHLLYYK